VRFAIQNGAMFNPVFVVSGVVFPCQIMKAVVNAVAVNVCRLVFGRVVAAPFERQQHKAID